MKIYFLHRFSKKNSCDRFNENSISIPDDDLHVKTVQSPIAISIRESKVRDDVKQLEFHGHFENDGKAFVENTGTSARVKFLQRNKQPYISGGVLRPNERYIFEELHFHWTDTNDAGCEHEINGQTYGFLNFLNRVQF